VIELNEGVYCVLYTTTSYCTLPLYTILHCNVHYCTALYCYVCVHYSTVLYITVLYFTGQSQKFEMFTSIGSLPLSRSREHGDESPCHCTSRCWIASRYGTTRENSVLRQNTVLRTPWTPHCHTVQGSSCPHPPNTHISLTEAR